MDKNDEYQLAQMVQDFGQNVIAAGTSKKDRQFAKDQSNLAYQRSMDHYHQVNAYNTPKEQMKRTKEAGLNPNLIYGNMANTPATASAQYQPAKTTTNQPTARTDHSRFLMADIQQQSVDQQRSMQTQILDQQIRMNDHMLQNWEIKNRNMEEDTINKTASSRSKMLDITAKSLGIISNYGIDPKSGEKVGMGLKDYDLGAKKLSNEMLEKQIAHEIKKMSETELKVWWSAYKQLMMETTGINIDKDVSWQRAIGTGFNMIDWEYVKKAIRVGWSGN